MKIAKIERRGLKVTTYHNCNLQLDRDIIVITGPRYGFIANGIVQNTATSYNGSEYHLHLTILVEKYTKGVRRYIREEWYVKFK